MSKKDERIEKLIDILKVRAYVPIRELAALLGVSEMTIRRDIDLLKQSRAVENISGTAVYSPALNGNKEEQEYALFEEQQQKNMQKDTIGRFAASLVEEGDIIILDTGSTTERIVPHLPTDKKLTVLCYNINILMELHRNPGVDMLFAGGKYHPNTQMFESPEGIEYIRNLRASKVFVSAAGVHADLGITCRNSYEVPTKRAILKSSLQKILVTDSSKFDVVRSAYFCDLSDIDIVITDSGLSKEWIERITALGIKLYFARCEDVGIASK